MTDSVRKQRKTVFVIMPFVESPTRGEKQLTSFFTNNLKQPIESAEGLDFAYTVRRSDVTFDITRQIMLDLLRADIVIADLSGVTPNPNVMYELGVRLAVSQKPVILIREEHRDNKKVFDVQMFYIHPYDPLDYAALEKHLIDKISRFETGEETAESPIHRMLGVELARMHEADIALSPEAQHERVLAGANHVLSLLRNAFGPRGGKVAIARPGHFQEVTKRSREIVASVSSTELLEGEGEDVIRQIVTDMDERVGDGGKLAALVAGAYLSAAESALADGYSAIDIIEGADQAFNAALGALTDDVFTGEAYAEAAARTAAGDDAIASGVINAAHWAGGIQYVSFESASSNQAIEVIPPEGHWFNVALAFDELVLDKLRHEAEFARCLVLVTTEKLTSMRVVLPVLEMAAQEAAPLLIFADAVDGEVLATLLVNIRQGTLRAAVVRIVATGLARLDILDDVAALTGAQVIAERLGTRLEDVRRADLGFAARVKVREDSVVFEEPRSDNARLQQQIDVIRVALVDAVGIERDRLLQRYAGLTGKGATVLTGGLTEDQQRDFSYRAISAAAAYASAIQFGAVPGGGAALYASARDAASITVQSAGEQAGADAAAAGLRAPLLEIGKSCGWSPAEVVASLSSEPRHCGIDAAKKEMPVNLVDRGIVDAAEIVRQAVERARVRVRSVVETRVWNLSALKRPTEII